MRYRDYLLHRVARTIPILVGLSLLIFFIARVMPGDPARLALGPEATEDQVRALRDRLGLNEPLHIQYAHFFAHMFRGELGISLYTYRDVSIDLVKFFPATLELVLTAMALAIIIGIPLGVVSAVNKDRWPDHFSRVSAFMGVSAPTFWVGIMFQLLVCHYFRLLPTTGRIASEVLPPYNITGLYLFDSLVTLNFEAFISSLKHIMLPAVTLALSPTAQITRIVRSSMIDQKYAYYVVTAKSNGIPENLLVYKYMLKNALIATLTIAGLLTGFFLIGAFVVETVFGWPGIARYGVRALIYKDFNAVIGVILLTGAVYTLINLIVDFLYGYVDPRIRLGMEQR